MIFSNRALFFLFLLATPTQSLEILTASGWTSLEIINREGETVIIKAEIADTEKLRILGLAARESLGLNEGFLLDFGQDIRPRMWMKNTRFSLDMLFIDSFGQIRFIYPKAVPFSLRIISPDVKVRYVLEITAGQTGYLGIKVGDEVRMLPSNSPTRGLN